MKTMTQKTKIFKCSYKPSPSRFRDLSEKVKQPLPIYHDVNGEETTDVTLANLDPFGNPIHVGYSKKEYTLLKSSKPLCLDPADPAQRLRAIESRARMEHLYLEPTIYDDPFKIAEHASNVATKVYDNLIASKNVTNPHSNNNE